MSGSMAEVTQMASVPQTEAQLPGTASLVDELALVAAELGETGDEPETSPETPESKQKDAERPKPAKKETEGKPTVKDHVAFREERRTFKQQAAAKEQELAQIYRGLQVEKEEIERLRTEAQSAPPARLVKLFEDGDLDGFVKSLGLKEIDSWEKLNDHAARQFASPEYRQVRAVKAELEREKAAREARDAELAKREEAWRQDQSARQQAANREAAVVELTASLSQSADPHVAKLAEKDPRFSRAVLKAIEDDNSLDVEEAAEIVLKVARDHAAILGEVFGTQTPSKSETAQAVSPNRAGRKEQLARPAKHVSRTTASEASPPTDENLTDAQWLALAEQEMKRASKAEAEERRLR